MLSIVDDAASMIRLKLWALLALCSIVCFGSILEVSKRTGRNGYDIFVVCVGVITTCFSAVLLLVIVRDMRLKGSDTELSLIAISMILWTVALPVVFHGVDAVTDSTHSVMNANIFYASWLAYFSIVGLLFAFLKQYRDIDIVSQTKKRGSRFLKWTVVGITSLVMMATSTDVYRNEQCKGTESVEASGFWENSGLDRAVYCKRTALAIGLGAASTFVCMLILSELLYLGDDVDNLLESETLFACFICIAFAVSVGYITGDQGPGRKIGNMYYSAWATFISSSALALECVLVTMDATSDNDTGTESGGDD